MKNTNRHWYVVAHRSGARIFEQEGVKPELRLVIRFENPDGSLKTSELVPDRQGRSDSSDNSGHNPVGDTDTPRQNVLQQFARLVGKYLEQEAEGNSFDSLVLVAEPQVLGELRKAIGRVTSQKLGESVGKDLVNVTDFMMSKQLSEVGVLCLREAV